MHNENICEKLKKKFLFSKKLTVIFDSEGEAKMPMVLQ